MFREIVSSLKLRARVFVKGFHAASAFVRGSGKFKGFLLIFLLFSPEYPRIISSGGSNGSGKLSFKC